METDHDKLVRIDVETRNQTKLLNQINSKLDKTNTDHSNLKERMDKVEGAVGLFKWGTTAVISSVGLVLTYLKLKGP